MEKAKSALENITVSFRVILPLLFAMFMYSYTGDQTRLHAEMAEIKDTSNSIRASIESNNRKVACMNQDIAKCYP